MTKLIINIYDYLRSHRIVWVMAFIVMTVGLVGLTLRLDFKEDISDFLPLDDVQQESMAVYQDVSGAGKILAIFQAEDTLNIDPDAMVGAINLFASKIEETDTTSMVRNLVIEFDLEKLTELTDFVYYNIPYFLTDADLAQMDAQLADSSFVTRQLDADKQMLMFPTTGVLAENLRKDPLNLFSPIVSRLQRAAGADVEMYDGCIFTADMKRAIAIMESPYGNSETKSNAKLMSLLEQVALEVEAETPGIKMHYIGGPSIAVGNADRIKKDSILSIAIAAVLILALLFVAFRRTWNIVLIAVSVAWGWLFAVAMLSVVHSSVSLIVVGISSIILGIAVNYPLHLIAHTAHTGSMRQVLREIISPLIIGNITTVGAFMALVPLKAAALRDLGIFSAFILVGTILFVVVFLPHAVKQGSHVEHKVGWLDKLSNFQPENSRWMAWVVVALTCVFAYYSTHTEFDSNMAHINYMTDEQKADMEYFKQMTSGEAATQQCLYVVSTGATLEEALNNSARLQPQLRTIAAGQGDASLSSSYQFMPSRQEQERRLASWKAFVNRHKEVFNSELRSKAAAAGFQPDAFDEFEQIVSADFAEVPAAHFAPLSTVNGAFLSIDSEAGRYRVVDMLYVDKDSLDAVKQQVVAASDESTFVFDVPSMNSALASGLSDNFNYIGWACGLIVFFFLWFSFASLELALLSFLPMAVSWVWIMGIMGLTGIQFNIVNIILATFIFGQGDDYTIFMTEGCCYEYAFRRRMLASYKRSIIISALIMFIGIGTLIFAKHPALHSLAEVTIVGMFSVVLMAYLLPPLVFNWLTRIHGEYRKRPLTIGPLLRTWFCGAWWLSQLFWGYILGAILFGVFRRNSRTEALFHRFVTWCHRVDIFMMPGVKIRYHNPAKETLAKPCVIVCNHQSMLDPMFFMAWSPKIIIVANEHSSRNPIVRIMFRWLGFYTICQSNFTAWKDSTLERDMARFRNYVAQGYSIAFFPEGMRNPSSTVLRCHKGAFYLAQQLGLDILPVLLHGVNNLMPAGSFACYKGTININIGERITPESPLWSDNYSDMTRKVHKLLVSGYGELCRKYEDSAYFELLVKDRYRYKGTELMRTVCANLRRTHNFKDVVDGPQAEKVQIINAGYGEMALLMALVHPSTYVVAYEADAEKREVAKYSALGLVNNIDFRDMCQFEADKDDKIKVYDVNKILD